MISFQISYFCFRKSGNRLAAAKIFCDAGIPTTVILDSAVGKYLEFVSLCLVGAEGVTENGGIVNKVFNQINVKLTKKIMIFYHPPFLFVSLTDRNISDSHDGKSYE